MNTFRLVACFQHEILTGLHFTTFAPRLVCHSPFFFRKVAYNSFLHLDFDGSSWPCTIYRLMLQTWYQTAVQSLVNTLLSFSWHIRLPKQRYDLLKTPLITALGAHNLKTAWWFFFFFIYDQILISTIRRNFWKS